MTATHIRDIKVYAGHAALYRLEPAITTERWDGESEDWKEVAYTHVVVSAVISRITGPETYIFGADEDGAIVDWAELPGSYRGGLDHAQALSKYEIKVTA